MQNIFFRSLAISSSLKEEKNLGYADVHIKPPIEGGVLGAKGEKVVDIAYDETMKILSNTNLSF